MLDIVTQTSNSAPGLKFGYTGQTVAISFGNLTSDGVLVGYRIAGLDWQFTNVTAGGTHLLVTEDTPGSNLTYPISPVTLELRVTNWAYGIQLAAVHVAEGEKLVKVPDYGRRVEFIGDSLTNGMYTTYECLSGFGVGIGDGLGESEYSVTAFPGICAADQNCWGNPRGQARQWFYSCDTSGRAVEAYGGEKRTPSYFMKNSEVLCVEWRPNITCIYKQWLTSNYHRKPRECRALGLLEAIRSRSGGHQHRRQRPKPPQQYLDTDIPGQPHQADPGCPWRLAQRPSGPNGKHQR